MNPNAQQRHTPRDADAAGRDLTAEPSAEVGTPVAVGGIPARRPGFQPRPGLLAQLNMVGPEASAVQVLTGTPGAGRTQLAAAYARAKMAAGWRLVAWVNAENPGSLLDGLAAVADVAGLSDAGSGRGTADAGQLVRHWLEADGDRCLLVFDEARDPDMLRAFVPVSGAARVLITAGRESMADLGTTVQVDVFSTEEALALLAGRTGLDDEAGAAAVAAKLGCLPLALDQAAGVIAGRHQDYAAYLDRLQFLSAQNHLARAEEQEYPSGVAGAVLLALETVRADDPAGVCTGVMETMAVLSAAGIHRELLYAAGQAGFLARGRHRSRVSPEQVDWALHRLADQSLLTFSLGARTVVVHRLVMRVVRDGLVRQGHLTMVCRAAASILGAQVDTLARDSDRMAVRDVYEQVTALWENASGPAAQAEGELARVLLSLRYLVLHRLNELGDCAPQAIALGEPLVADVEDMLGPDHPNTLNARNSLASAYLAIGRPGDAIPQLEKTLTAGEGLLDADHPSTLATRNNLANAYRAAGRATEAIPLHEQNLAVCERRLGPGHPRTLAARNNLAAACSDAGRTGEAILLLEHILAVRERTLGVGHPDAVNSRHNLATAYLVAGRAAEAIPLFEQILAEQERHLGPDHPDAIRSRNNLADLYRSSGQIAEAIPLLRQILVARERQDVDHPSTLAVRNNLATAYRNTGQSTQAVPLYEQNLAACERLLGAGHPHTVTTRQNLTLVRQEAGRSAPA
jgi:tetratricopeptide (TPR) repeat protein